MPRFRTDRDHGQTVSRAGFLAFFCAFLGLLIIARLAQLQIIQHDRWAVRAAEQQEKTESLFPARGNIFIYGSDSADTLYPLTTNRTVYFFYAVPKDVKNPERTARLIAPLLQMDEASIRTKLEKSHDPWEPLKHRIDEETAQQIDALQLSGIVRLPEPSRYYTDKKYASHVVGFVRFDGARGEGQYGIEGYFDELLRGKEGSVRFVKDAKGESILGLGGALIPAENGADIILTIDRNVQFFACEQLRIAVEKHGASGGSVLILDPKSGAVRAMCSVPDFDPNSYQTTKDQFTFNNPATFLDYEPGSTFKPITMAAGLEAGTVQPETTYEDTGSVRLGVHTIRNSDGKAHGTQSMTQILEESLNTGAVFVARTLDKEIFRQFVENFGFGKPTGVELATEIGADIRSLAKRGEIYTATASYGQGITVTPMQMVAAYATIANGGTMMKPYIVDEIRYPDGRREKKEPVTVRRVISERTATLVSGMLVSVVRHGHGKRADVPGYTVAGKTGTAQIARRDGPGYEKNANIGSFIGYAPIEDPKFVMITKIDRPKDVLFAESSAAPLFGTIAKFLLEYYKVAPGSVITNSQ